MSHRGGFAHFWYGAQIFDHGRVGPQLYRGPVPEISRFLGIVISMYHQEHGLPHFHAVYGEREVSVELDSGIARGKFPLRHISPLE